MNHQQKPTARRYDVTCRNCGQTIEQVGIDTVPIRQWIGAWSLACYLYNASGVKFATDVYGADANPDYIREKADVYAQSPARALANLDFKHFEKLIRLALEEHGEEAARQWVVHRGHGLR